MTAHAAEPTPVVPPMPERNPKALREAIAEHAAQLLSDFDEHWKWAVADAYDISTVPAFMDRWWGQFGIARDPRLAAHVTDLEHRAAVSTDINENVRKMVDAASGCELRREHRLAAAALGRLGLPELSPTRRTAPASSTGPMPGTATAACR
ncbi:hypothetical protein ACFU3E_01695 [Streptomyces sp. NPDC057424]|uniref:hypothetical protein n=1 Tax=Streptomyces sp. NPDC057424 TaxID=3346127 RepID=UPI00369C600F